MFDGRHCTLDDYLLLQKYSESFFKYFKWDKCYEDDYKNFVQFIEDFDFEIASKMRWCLVNYEIPPEEKKQIIADLIDELKLNVLVDVREHN